MLHCLLVDLLCQRLEMRVDMRAHTCRVKKEIHVHVCNTGTGTSVVFFSRRKNLWHKYGQITVPVPRLRHTAIIVQI